MDAIQNRKTSSTSGRPENVVTGVSDANQWHKLASFESLRRVRPFFLPCRRVTSAAERQGTPYPRLRQSQKDNHPDNDALMHVDTL